MKKTVPIVLIILFIGITVSFVYFISSNNASSNSNTQTSQNDQATSTQNTEPDKEYSVEEVKTHSSQTDCWTIIAGDVYDITSYIPRHPGGDEILKACGNEGTTLFTSRTTEDGQKVGSGTAHSVSAENILISFKIGTIKK